MRYWILIGLLTLFAVVLALAIRPAPIALAQGGGPQLILTVNSLLDDQEPVADRGDGVCDVFPAVAGDTCTLRAAIQELNAYGASTGATHRIEFSFSGATPYVIAPNSELPWIETPVEIDGATVAGAACPTGDGDVATLNMVLDGINASDANGFYLRSPSNGSIIRGFVIGNFDGSGIRTTGDFNLFRCNFIGVAADGMTAMPNDGDGILINGNNNSVGGQAHAYRNVISGNSYQGVRITGDNNIVEGNYIGATADGLNTLVNSLGGVYIGGNDNQVGGSALLSRNLIVNNDFGIKINSGNTNTIQGNYFGMSWDGVTPLMNSYGQGIEIVGDATGNVIGGLGSGEGNIIANSDSTGISLRPSQGNFPAGAVIRGNAIFDNGELGIDLSLTSGGDGVTPNDGAPDSDAGPNDLLNFPVLSAVKTDDVNVFFTLDYAGKTGFHEYDLYLNDSCDSSGYGEGQDQVYSSSFLTDGSGLFNNSGSFSQTGAAGKYLVATATLGGDGTSEFSACAQVADLTSFVVNDKGDDSDFDTADGRCDIDGDAGNGDTCTLRAAIEQANAASAPGPITIEFNIPDPGNNGEVILNSGVSPWPALTQPVILDATTQPGAACPTASTPTSIYITLDGSQLASGDGLLSLSGNGSTVKGFAIVNFINDGIQIDGDDNTVQCNFIGVARDGVSAAPNLGQGVDITGDNNTIGGDVDTFRNVISGNGNHGVRLSAAAQGNSITGNLIGLGDDGQTAVGNSVYGIRFWNADSNTISDNVISANGSSGVAFANGSDGNTITDNTIGLDKSGAQDRGNGDDGIVLDASHNNTIGGSGKGNTISGNGLNGIRLIASNTTNIRDNLIGMSANGSTIIPNDADGITVNNSDNSDVVKNTIKGNAANGVAVRSQSQQNRISQNSIYNNSGLGIDLNEDGITANDPPPDSDTGGNDLQNYPVLTVAAMDLVVAGRLESAYAAGYTLEFFRAASCQGTGETEGEEYLGSYITATDGSGVVDFVATLGADVNVGEFIVATATDAVGNTSEFSPCIQVSDALIINNSGDAPDLTPGDGVCDSAAGLAGPQCTLRAAIEEVNALAAPSQDVFFAIEGSGPHTITPASFLPGIKETVNLDAITYQAGASCPDGLQIEIDGSAISATTIDGLNLTGSSSGSVVQGLAIGNFPQSGLKMRLPNSTARCNYLGLRADGVTPMPNQVAGLTILADDVTVGGAAVADRNVISGNASHGILIDGANADRNNALIQNNYIGVDASGLASLANGGDGIRVDNGDNADIKQNVISGNTGDGIGFYNTSGGSVTMNAIGLDKDKLGAIPNQQGVVIGDSSALEIGGDINLQLYNWISGNTYSGIRLNSGGSSTNFIRGNIIGQDFNGDPTGNGTNGVFVNGGDNIFIGGSADFGNVIADNGGDGIRVVGASYAFISLRNNNVFDNNALGIDFNGDGVTANASGNGIQNFPELYSAAPANGTTEVIGKLDSFDSTYLLDFYRNVGIDPSGYGEGETPTGSMSLNTDGSHVFLFPLPNPVPVGEYITSVATENQNGALSSEFSAAIQVANCTPPPSFDPGIAIAGSDVQLTWSSPSSVDFYVFRSADDPYFTSYVTYDVTQASVWTDPDANELGDAATNYFYTVRGADGCASQPGQTVGEFDFALTPGAP